MSLPRFGVMRPVPVNLLMVAMLMAGLYAGVHLRRQFFPEQDPMQAMVTLPYPGATPAEIEQNLVLKVEDALADLDEVERLNTAVSEGSGSITVEFKESIRSVAKATDEVERTIDALQDLPDESETIRVTEFEPRMPAIMMSLYGDVEEAVLKDAIRGIRDELKTLPGMGEVVVSGVRNYEVRVDVDADALIEHGISLPQVSDTIQQWMAEVPGGVVRGKTGNINVRTMGIPERSEAIRQIVVKASADGQSLRVGDIASVVESFVDEQIVTRFNGKPCASLTVYKVGDQDIVKMAEMVRTYAAVRRGETVEEPGIAQLLGRHRIEAAELAAASATPLPDRVQIEVHSDLARFVEGRLSLLTRNALQGSALVFATLLIFLNVRLAFWGGDGAGDRAGRYAHGDGPDGGHVEPADDVWPDHRARHPRRRRDRGRGEHPGGTRPRRAPVDRRHSWGRTGLLAGRGDGADLNRGVHAAGVRQGTDRRPDGRVADGRGVRALDELAGVAAHPAQPHRS